MDESQPPAVSESPAVPAMSLGARLTNIFVAPTEVFDSVKQGQPDQKNWIIPTVLVAVIGVIFTFIIFSQPAVIQRIRNSQEQAFQKQVTAGKMTQKQADDALAVVDRFMGPAMLKALGILGATIGSAVYLFVVALAFWLVAKYALHAEFEYLRAAEAVGLTMMISVLAGIIQMLLAVIYGNPAVTLGPALFVGNFDSTNKIHLLLAAFNVMSLWYVAVLSIGLSRFSGASFPKAAYWMYGLWALVKLGPLSAMLLLQRPG